ncbi:MAG: DUF2878 domain-containing protein [Planctomycetota bacterium]
MLKNIVNIICMQIGWFACVLSMASGVPSFGVFIVAVLVVGQLLHSRRRNDVLLVCVLGLAGAAIDTGLGAVGIVEVGNAPNLVLTYVWFAALWANFATVLNRSLAWLRAPWLAFAFGALGGPPAYLGAEALGALALPQSMTTTLLTLAAYWGVAMLVAVVAARRFSGEGLAATTESAGRDNGGPVGLGTTAMSNSRAGLGR